MTGDPRAELADAGRRARDAHELARIAGHAGHWLALRLSDGGSDGQAYPTRADAVRHQLHETQCAYVQVHPGVMSEREAVSIIRTHRAAYAAGYRLADPPPKRR